jgi:hypothetical protein
MVTISLRTTLLKPPGIPMGDGSQAEVKKKTLYSLFGAACKSLRNPLR